MDHHDTHGQKKRCMASSARMALQPADLHDNSGFYENDDDPDSELINKLDYFDELPKMPSQFLPSLKKKKTENSYLRFCLKRLR